MEESNLATILCPDCGYTEHRKAGFKQLSKRKIQQYQCKKCGRIFHE